MVLSGWRKTEDKSLGAGKDAKEVMVSEVLGSSRQV